MPAHPVAVKLDADVHARVRELAQAQHRSPHYLMREAIAQYVEREEKREAFRQEALTAWAASVCQTFTIPIKQKPATGRKPKTLARWSIPVRAR